MGTRSFALICIVLVLGMTASTTMAELVAYWPMDEGSGTTVSDVSGNGHDGEITGEGLEWVESQAGYGTALLFAGEANPEPIVLTGVWNPSEGTGRLSLATWLHWEGPNAAGWQSIIAKHIAWNSTETCWALSVDPTQRFDLGVFGGSRTFAASPLENQWQHVAVSFDGATATLYLDGTEVDAKDFALGPAEEAPVLIGAGFPNGWNPFNGAIDEVHLYNDVLAESEIQALVMGNIANAWRPHPENGATDVSIEVTLSWTPGILDENTETLYNEHHVYFGTSFEDVNAATEPLTTLSVNEYAVSLDSETTYYWRVDEVAEGTEPAKGKIWSFTTGDFLVVDDFESYNDDDNVIYDTWIDGWINGTGSTVGNLSTPYAERGTIHSGRQSMPFSFDNFNAPFYSEAERSWATPQDWTAHNFDSLSLWWNGVSSTEPTLSNPAEPLYFGIEDSAANLHVITHPDPEAIQAERWQEWPLQLTEFSDNGVDLTAVQRLVLGIGNRVAPVSGFNGKVYFDDLRLYPSRQQETVEPALVAYWPMDEGSGTTVSDVSGNGHDGQITGEGLEWVESQAGYGTALLFAGEANPEPIVHTGVWNPSEGTGRLSFAAWLNWEGPNAAGWQSIIAKHIAWNEIGTCWALSVDPAGTFDLGVFGGSRTFAASPLENQWQHVAVSFDGTTATLYLDGTEVDARDFALGPAEDAPVVIGAGFPNGWNPFNGTIDEVRLYNDALTAEQMEALVAGI